MSDEDKIVFPISTSQGLLDRVDDAIDLIRERDKRNGLQKLSRSAFIMQLALNEVKKIEEKLGK